MSDVNDVMCEVAAADLSYYIILAWKTGIVRKLKSGATGRESNVGSLEYDWGGDNHVTLMISSIRI